MFNQVDSLKTISTSKVKKFKFKITRSSKIPTSVIFRNKKIHFYQEKYFINHHFLLDMNYKPMRTGAASFDEVGSLHTISEAAESLILMIAMVDIQR